LDGWNLNIVNAILILDLVIFVRGVDAEEKDMINTESFVAFYGGEKAHYECMRLDDAKRAEDKTFE